jgi:hypothetical protein
MPARAPASDARLMHREHATPHVKAELEELRHEAEVGESARTPLILLSEVWVVCAIAVVIGIAIGLLAYRLA